MVTLRKLRSTIRIVCPTSVFLIVILLFPVQKNVALEKRMDRTVHYFKEENQFSQQSNDGNNEISKPPISTFNVHGTDQDIEAESVPLYITELGYITRICIHDISVDSIVSGSLRRRGVWEKDSMIGFGMQLRTHPGSIFIDVGCHVGTFAMQAAALGHKVIVIDPLRSNLQLLSKYIRLAHQEENVTFLWNAVSNIYETVNLRYTKKQNIGSTRLVRKGDKEEANSLRAVNYTVETILLDDIVEKFNLRNKNVIMKMDIERSEFLALLGASKLFRYNTVCFVSVILEHAKTTGTLQPIVELMKAYGFELFADPLLTINVDKRLESIDLDGFFKNKKCK